MSIAIDSGASGSSFTVAVVSDFNLFLHFIVILYVPV
jgi:hypothetical protein